MGIDAAFAADRQIPLGDNNHVPVRENDLSRKQRSGILKINELSKVKLKKSSIVLGKDKLQLSMVVKVFGGNYPVFEVAKELRRQWSQFGKFHITSLGLGWTLCSFFDKTAVDKVLEGGPWYVNDHIVGIDKWSPLFSPTSLKGLSSPIWVRFPHLPLICWDEENVTRISSKIGVPLRIVGNMFQWSKREYARICVRMQLDQ
ncbi:uncharacterized protein LOC110108399 [Dendrobium catenatum]|uniref:uncharacterized protein LOC110108399 n=1 Tax=Dendrobium catenatum TaxID=906689 RepID=UPI0009F19F02|nr:uncharacterized protein LOC110108399 [Dendrobium catenatum]